MRRLISIGIVVFATSCIITPSLSAGSGSTTCSLNYYCVNKNTVPFAYTGTSMTNGWRHYPGNATSGTIATDFNLHSYSNGGGVVAGHILTIRNRNNITGRIMCLVNWTPDVGDYYTNSAPFYNAYWVNNSNGAGYRAIWVNSTTTC